MNNMLRVVVVASFVFVLAACGQKAAQTAADVASSVPTVPAKDDNAAWKTYLGQVVSITWVIVPVVRFCTICRRRLILISKASMIAS